MNENIRSTNLRFNLEKEPQRQAWEYLQTMNKAQFKSYSQTVALALVDYFDRYYKSQVDPYFETREREERFVSQIVTAVETAMEKTLPVFFVGCMAGLSATMPMQVSALPQTTAENTDADVDWDFLGITYDGAKEVNT